MVLRLEVPADLLAFMLCVNGLNEKMYNFAYNISTTSFEKLPQRQTPKIHFL